MIPDTAVILRDHLARNGCENAVVVENALTDLARQKVMAHVVPGRSGIATVVERESKQSVCVETTTLNAVLEGYAEIHLLKMDLEGAEAMALRGANEVIDAIRAIIFEDRTGDSPARGMLEQRGFKIKPLGLADVLAHRH